MNHLEYKLFSKATEADALRVINAYLTGWPFTRPVDEHLMERWHGLDRLQPDWMGLAYHDGEPRAFIHGEQVGSSSGISPENRLATLIDTSCYIHPSASIGRGCVMFPHGFVGLNAIIAGHVFMLAGRLRACSAGRSFTQTIHDCYSTIQRDTISSRSLKLNTYRRDEK